MLSWLRNLLTNMFGQSIARVLGGAGLAISVAAVMTPVVSGGLAAVVSYAGAIPSNILSVMLLGGFGEILTILGTAMMTRIGMRSTSLGIKKASGG